MVRSRSNVDLEEQNLKSEDMWTVLLLSGNVKIFLVNINRAVVMSNLVV